MKVVVNAMSARLGGGQTYLYNLFLHLPDAGDLQILVFAPPTVSLPHDSRVVRVQTPWPTTNPFLRAAWEKIWLPSYLRSHKADVLFCPGGVVGTSVPRGCSVVTMFRNMIPFDLRVRKSMPFGWPRFKAWLLKRIMLNSMRDADITIFISDFARGVIESLIHVRKSVTIPHGINAMFRTHNRVAVRPKTLPHGEYLLYVSRFDVYKHHREVLEAYSTLPTPLQERFKLVFVGETDSPEARSVADLRDRLGLQDRVMILGAVPYQELPVYYRSASAIIFASSCENCPNILLEGLGAGRPVVSSNVMPMPEFGGDSVEYFSPFEPVDIARALQRVLENPRLADELGSRAASLAARYDWKTTSERTWDAILGLLESRESRRE